MLELLPRSRFPAGKRRRDGWRFAGSKSGAQKPLAHYTLGWLLEKVDDPKAAQKHFKMAAALPPDYCLPARLEEIAILETAMRANPADAKASYYLGNLLYDRRRHTEAITFWEKSARLDGNFPTVWRNLGIGYFNISKKPAKARAAYDQAFKADPNDARLLFERDQLWKRLAKSLKSVCDELEQFPQLVSPRRRFDVGILRTTSTTSAATAKRIQILAQRRFQPWEGGEGAALAARPHTARARSRGARASRLSSRGKPF